MFFDAQVFITFAEDCIKWGINCPVVPGLMCINGYGGFAKMTKFCKSRVPAKLAADMADMDDLHNTLIWTVTDWEAVEHLK